MIILFAFNLKEINELALMLNKTSTLVMKVKSSSENGNYNAGRPDFNFINLNSEVYFNNIKS